MEKKSGEISWLQAAKIVLQASQKQFLTVNEVLDEIIRKKLRDLTNCHKPYATLYAVMHNQAKKPNSAFVKKLDRVSYFAARKQTGRSKKSPTDMFTEDSEPQGDLQEVDKRQEKCKDRLVVSVDLSQLDRQPVMKRVAVRRKSRGTSGKVNGKKTEGKLEKGRGRKSEVRSKKVNGLRKSIVKPASWKQRKDVVSNCVKAKRTCEPSVKPSVKCNRSSFKLDVTTPYSLLIHLDLKHVINRENFLKLEPDQRVRLLEMLPNNDRQNGTDEILESTFCNNYFRAALFEWQQRLATGELTKEMRARMRQENLKQADPKEPDWKARFYEEVYGERSLPAVSKCVASVDSQETAGEVTSNTIVTPEVNHVIAETVEIEDNPVSLEESSMLAEDEDAEMPVPVKVL